MEKLVLNQSLKPCGNWGLRCSTGKSKRLTLQITGLMFFKMAPKLMSREFIRMLMLASISLESSSSRKYWTLFLTVK